MIIDHWSRRNLNNIVTKKFSDQPKPFILHCPLPESHQNQAPASVSVVRDKINTFWIHNKIHKTSYETFVMKGRSIMKSKRHLYKVGRGGLRCGNKQPEGGFQPTSWESGQEGLCCLCLGTQLPPRRSFCQVFHFWSSLFMVGGIEWLNTE